MCQALISCRCSRILLLEFASDLEGEWFGLSHSTGKQDPFPLSQCLLYETLRPINSVNMTRAFGDLRSTKNIVSRKSTNGLPRYISTKENHSCLP